MGDRFEQIANCKGLAGDFVAQTDIQYLFDLRQQLDPLQRIESEVELQVHVEMNVAVESRLLPDHCEDLLRFLGRLQQFISRDEYKRDEIEMKEAQATLEQAELDLRIYQTYTIVQEEAQKSSDLQQAHDERDRVASRYAVELERRFPASSYVTRLRALLAERFPDEKP